MHRKPDMFLFAGVKMVYRQGDTMETSSELTVRFQRTTTKEYIHGR